MVGLSGLITPSLDEMVHVAQEMERRGFDAAAPDRRRDHVEAAHGGADRARRTRGRPCTCSTPRASSRPSPACSTPSASTTSTGRTASCRSRCASSTPSATGSRCSRSRPRAPTASGLLCDLAAPPFTGARPVEPSLETLARFVDWQFFFHAWELKGKFPAILDRPEARELYDDALALLEEITLDGRSARGACTGSGLPGRTATTSSSRTARDSASSASSPTTATPGRIAAWPTTSRRRGRDRRLRRRRPRRERARRPVRGRARRLPGDHGQGARRPARGGVRGVAARRGEACLVRAGRAALERGADRARAIAASARPSATPPVPTTARRRSCSSCSGRARPVSS